jgi:hypothetical protein
VNLAAAILVAMKLAVPCGNSAWSVEPVPAAECAADAKECPGAKRSSFYRGWVRKESATACEARYSKAAHALASELQGSERAVQEAGLVIGIAVNESGLREDVMVGRGRSGKPSDDGGQGRGPANEACLMQIIPSMAKGYGGADTLVGDSPEALRRCFRAALDQLRWARGMCPRKSRLVGPGVDVGIMFATIARYGTGLSCISANVGKTARREKTALWMTAVIDREMRKGAGAS